jgi:predicted RNA-binding Zn-ribbon protein involved in translation (DUF1610 family)
MENVSEIIKEKTDRFPCPACGGNMSFDPDSQSLICPYCSNKIDITTQQGDIKEYDFNSAEENAPQNWGAPKRVMKCESCGAETVLDENTAAQFCSFCGSSHIIKNDSSAGIAPESLIPFKISQQKALGLFKAWVGKRFFAPRALKSGYQVQRLTGTYIPFWTYDTDTYSTYSAEAGTYYYVTETDWVERNGKKVMVTRQVRKTSWRHVSGVYSEFFNDVLVNASNQIDESLMKKLEPFEFSELLHYKPEFLSGFIAERYSIGLKEGWQRALNFIKSGINSGITRSINADEVRNLMVSSSYNDVKYKHILLPIWISAYTYKNKVFRYMVNGQTGEVQGKAPVSPWKVSALVLLGAALIVAFVIFMKYYG